MAYHPGTLYAALSAAVGEEPLVIAELRADFLASASAHIAGLAKQSAEQSDITHWRDSAARLHSLSAGFGAMRVMTLAAQAGAGTPFDAGIVRRLCRALTMLRDDA